MPDDRSNSYGDIAPGLNRGAYMKIGILVHKALEAATG